jgi:hypothetical protein
VVQAVATTMAGTAAAAVTANPLLAAAAGEAAKSGTEQLLNEFLPAQKEALDRLAERTSAIERLLGDVHSDVQALMDGPWQAAWLHIADAARHPNRARAELHLARHSLYLAWGSASSNAKRAQISQELSVVHALLGEWDDSRQWLFQSLSKASDALADGVAGVIESAAGLPRVTDRVKGDHPIFADVPADVLAIYFDLERRPTLCVRPEPLLTALDRLAETRVDLSALRSACAVAGMPASWREPESANVLGALWDATYPQVELRVGSRHLMVRGSHRSLPMRPVQRLNEIGRWRFSVKLIPFEGPVRVFVSGSSPELGAWSEDRAVPLWPEPGRLPWIGTIHTLDSDRDEPVEYKYFCVLRPGASAVWEDGPARRLPPASLDRLGAPQRVATDLWRAA